jgi:hypothetical protein
MLLSAVALIAGIQMAGAGAASADTCWVDGDGGVHCMYDGGETVGTPGGGGPGGGGGGGGNRHRPIIGDPDAPIEPAGPPPPPTGKTVVGVAVALKVDNVLAQNEACRNLVTGVAPNGFQNALQVWNAVPITKSATPRNPQPAANADADFNAGSTGSITIYPPFYTQKGDDVFGYIPSNNGLSRLPSDEEMKARTVLHELAHLTGALGPHTDPDPAAKEFNLRILETCFGIQRLPV